MDPLVESLIGYLDTSLDVPENISRQAIQQLTLLVSQYDYPYPFVDEVEIIDPSLQPLIDLPFHLPDVAIIYHYIHHKYPRTFPRLNNLLHRLDPRGLKTFSFRTYGCLRLRDLSTQLAEANPTHPMNVIVRALNEPSKYTDYAFAVRLIVAANDFAYHCRCERTMEEVERFLLTAHRSLITQPISEEQITLLYHLAMSSRFVIFPRPYDKTVEFINLLILTLLYLVSVVSFHDSLHHLPSLADSMVKAGPFTRIFKGLFAAAPSGPLTSLS